MSSTSGGPPIRILLRGYYGFGNLGDDLLLSSLYSHLRREFPLSTLEVETPGPGTYLPDLLGSEVPQHEPGSPANVDAVVLGGGGVFFDFRSGPWWRAVSNRLVRGAGLRRYARAVRLVRRFLGRLHLEGGRWYAAGVGVGDFGKGSRKFLEKAETLGVLEWAYVRDPQSARRLRKLRPDLAVDTFADPVYSLTEVPPMVPSQEAASPWDVCFILRDWEWGFPLYPRTWETVGAELAQSGISVGLISFDPTSDRNVIRAWKGMGTVLEWDPLDPDSLSRIWQHLAGSRMVVTSRAHGLILATMAGVPTLVVEVDPKLEDLRSTLPPFVEGIGPEPSPPRAVESILQRLAEPSVGREEILREADAQARSARAGLRALSEELRAFRGDHA